MIKKNTELVALTSPALRAAVGNMRFSCWEKVAPQFTLYLFTLLVEDGQEIMDSWETITNNIASEFQASLSKQVEIWNIYVVILSKNRLGKELKYRIEQNKYSSRKLVFDGFEAQEWNQLLTEETVATFLNNKLFSLAIAPAAPVAATVSLDALLRKDHAALLNIIGDSNATNYYKLFFDKYLEDNEH